MTTVRDAVRAGVEVSDATRAGDVYLVERDASGSPVGWLRTDSVVDAGEWR